MPDEKKIIIDEDWKSQVQAEKEQAAKSTPSASQSAAGPPEQDDSVSMPPASLELLLTMLATEALVALGQVPHPLAGKPVVQRNQAQYLIDLIEVLRDKTQGNVTPGEQQLIETLLHQLRLAYVESATNPPTAGDTSQQTP